MKTKYLLLFFLMTLGSITVAQSTHLYVVDWGNCTITKYNEDGSSGSDFGAMSSHFYYPFGIACDNTNGDIFAVENYMTAGIYKIPFSGSGYTLLSDLANFSEIALDAADNKVFVTRQDPTENDGKGSIYAGTLSGSFSKLTALDGYVNSPRGIATDIYSNRIFVVNRTNILVANYDGSNPVTYAMGGLLNDPWGIALDILHGKIYIVNRATSVSPYGPYAILRANLDGTSPENLGNPNSLLDQPYDIAINTTQGKLYITSYNNAKVVRTDLDGNGGTAIITGGFITNPSGITIDIDNPMPVELSSFTASAEEDKVVLRWQTQTEINNYGFEVERAVTGSLTGLPDYKKIGFIAGSGNSNSVKSYSFTDRCMEPGKYSYRLKQIDNDGKFEYSMTAEAAVAVLPAEYSLSQNYPNPFNPETVIRYQIPKAAHVNLAVYDMLGKKVVTLVDEVKSAGTYSAEFRAQNLKLASGIYYYKLQSEGFSQIRKCILLK